jgi:hypothetical protein
MRIRYPLPGNDDSPTRQTRGDLLTGYVVTNDTGSFMAVGIRSHLFCWRWGSSATLDGSYVERDSQRVLGSICTSTLAMALPSSRICFDPWLISSSQVKASKRVRVTLVMCFLSLSGAVAGVSLTGYSQLNYHHRLREWKVRLGVK